jgi:hypothetical protein
MFIEDIDTDTGTDVDVYVYVHVHVYVYVHVYVDVDMDIDIEIDIDIQRVVTVHPQKHRTLRRIAVCNIHLYRESLTFIEVLPSNLAIL